MGFIAVANWTEYEIEGAAQPHLCTACPLTNYPNSHPQFTCTPVPAGALGGSTGNTTPTSIATSSISSDLTYASIRPI